MDPQYWNMLELPTILHRLAEHTSFSAGNALALSLAPSTDLEQVRHRQAETSEARRLLAIKTDITLGGVHDVRPQVQNAQRGAHLSPQELLDVRDTLRRAHLLNRSISRQREQFPILAGIAGQFRLCPEVVDEISRCIGEYGEVLDSASPALARIRAELKIAYDRLMDRLNRLIANPENSPHLQEGYVTQRDGRYVIPLKSQSRGRIPGLVHDQSSSGATLFIEPLATVELNNQYREAQLQEQREIERILLALSGLVADHAEAIVATVEALAQLDLALAKARYADGISATAPEMVPFARLRSPKGQPDGHPGSLIDLRQARHPLLDPHTVVPIDVRLGGDDPAMAYLIIVITGPNTGGKTVSLKTVGLLALMAQCGLHLPVGEGSRLTVFEAICADIGDEQSIQQSLSTFSSHMTHIIRILGDVDDRSLVLLDELGAGTDPVEGAALAQSLLIHLLQRRVTALVTTHHPELKLFAHNTPGVVNACVEFDVETLSPTYRLTIGLPGHSNAFSIARRLGLSEVIVRRAQAMISEDDLRVEQFLSEIKQMRAQLDQTRAELDEQRAATARLQAELRDRLLRIEEERQAILSQARDQSLEELEAMRKELRALQRKLASGGGAQAEWAQVEAHLEVLSQKAASAALPLPDLVLPLDGAIDVGDTVWIADLNTTGEVLALDGQAAEVQTGAFRVRVGRPSLQLRRKRAVAEAIEGEGPAVSLPPTPPISVELHLRGLRVDEGLDRLEKYLDDAYRAQAPFVRIVHGKGTGRLKQAIRERLRTHPLVASFQDGAEGEGDTGVTVIKFR